MKKNYSLLILFFYCLSMSYANKFALLIGVSNYPKQSNWIQLNAGNDLVLLNNTYQKLGFPKGNIEIIENEKATKQGIIQALKKLNTAVKSGDIVVFHFSGHGQQVMDITGDEIDGYDEAIVPYDAPKIFKKGQYEGQNHLLDEELGDLLQNIRKTLGYEGQLFVSIDACHSGSGTRSLTTARGTNQPLAARDYVVAHQQLDKAEKPHLNANNEAQLAPMIAFFSASPNELSYEFPDAQGKNYGSFSSALAITLLKANETTTYASIFEQIRIIMNIRSNIQNPQYEGAVEFMNK